MTVRRYAIPATLLLGCALQASVQRQDSVALSAPLASVLPAFGDYEVFEQTIPADQRLIAGMTSYVARVYHKDKRVAFSTFVAYYDSQTQGKSIHSPRNCLPGAGWEIVSGGEHELVVHGVPQVVNRYVLTNGKATAVAYYWYQGRGRVIADEYAVKWHLLGDAAAWGRTEEALVRVIVPLGRTQAVAAYADAAGANALFARLGPLLIKELDRVLPVPPGKRTAEARVSRKAAFLPLWTARGPV